MLEHIKDDICKCKKGMYANIKLLLITLIMYGIIFIFVFKPIVEVFKRYGCRNQLFFKP